MYMTNQMSGHFEQANCNTSRSSSPASASMGTELISRAILKNSPGIKYKIIMSGVMVCYIVPGTVPGIHPLQPLMCPALPISWPEPWNNMAKCLKRHLFYGKCHYPLIQQGQSTDD